MKTPNPAQLPRVQLLFSLMAKLPGGKRDFAQSLMDNFRRWGSLSPAQMEWVEKLIALAQAPPLPQPELSAHLRAIPGFKAVEDLLYHAGQFQKFPCIRLQTEKGQKIQLRPRLNERAVKVAVGDTSGICKDEKLDMSYLRFLGDPEDILNTLFEMAAHPVETAILYGKKHKSCCFCGIALTDPRSLHQGYGPICAENYGLPWGDKGPEVSVDELEALLEAQSNV